MFCIICINNGIAIGSAMKNKIKKSYKKIKDKIKKAKHKISKKLNVKHIAKKILKNIAHSKRRRTLLRKVVPLSRRPQLDESTPPQWDKSKQPTQWDKSKQPTQLAESEPSTQLDESEPLTQLDKLITQCDKFTTQLNRLITQLGNIEQTGTTALPQKSLSPKHPTPKSETADSSPKPSTRNSEVTTKADRPSNVSSNIVNLYKRRDKFIKEKYRNKRYIKFANSFAKELKEHLNKLETAQYVFYEDIPNYKLKRTQHFYHEDIPNRLLNLKKKPYELLTGEEQEKIDVLDKFKTLTPSKARKLLKPKPKKKSLANIDSFIKNTLLNYSGLNPKVWSEIERFYESYNDDQMSSESTIEKQLDKLEDIENKTDNEKTKRIINRLKKMELKRARIDICVKEFEKAGIDPVVGLKRLHKIILNTFTVPDSGGECFMFTTVTTLMQNKAIKDNYNALQRSLRESGKLDKFNEDLTKMFDAFEGGAVRQRKHVPFEIQNWIAKNRKEVATVILYEMSEALPKDSDAITIGSRNCKYDRLFLHSRILRNITRLQGYHKNFFFGGCSRVQLKALAKLIPNLDIKFINDVSSSNQPKNLYLALGHGAKDFGASNDVSKNNNDEWRIHEGNTLLNNVNDTFIYNPQSQSYRSEKTLRREIEYQDAYIAAYKNELSAQMKNDAIKKRDKYKEELKEPKYRIKAFSVHIPRHEYSVINENGKWSIYDIQEDGIKREVTPILDKRIGSYSLVHALLRKNATIRGVLFEKV